MFQLIRFGTNIHNQTKNNEIAICKLFLYSFKVCFGLYCILDEPKIRKYKNFWLKRFLFFARAKINFHNFLILWEVSEGFREILSSDFPFTKRYSERIVHSLYLHDLGVQLLDGSIGLSYSPIPNSELFPCENSSNFDQVTKLDWHWTRFTFSLPWVLWDLFLVIENKLITQILEKKTRLKKISVLFSRQNFLLTGLLFIKFKTKHHIILCLYPLFKYYREKNHTVCQM